MKIQKVLIAAVTLAVAVTLPTTSQAQLGGLLKKKEAAGAGSAGAADGASLLKQLTPGAIKFTQAYAKYSEALGDTENAAKMKVLADVMEKGGVLTKGQAKEMDDARKKILDATTQAKDFNDESKAKWKEANGLYGQGLVEWTVVSATVALALKDNPSAALTQPELGLAAGLCVKGLKDLTGFLGVAKAKSDLQKEMAKAAK